MDLFRHQGPVQCDFPVTVWCTVGFKRSKAAVWSSTARPTHFPTKSGAGTEPSPLSSQKLSWAVRWCAAMSNNVIMVAVATLTKQFAQRKPGVKQLLFSGRRAPESGVFPSRASGGAMSSSRSLVLERRVPEQLNLFRTTSSHCID